jgi:hypothetical protein
MDVVPCANGDLPKGYLTKPEFIKGLQDTCSFHDVVTELELESESACPLTFSLSTNHQLVD